MRWPTLAAALLLAACASRPPHLSPMPEGPSTARPAQMQDFCRRQPQDPRCSR